MRFVDLIKLPYRQWKMRRCRHEWAPSRSRPGYVCLRCGAREGPTFAAGDGDNG